MPRSARLDTCPFTRALLVLLVTVAVGLPAQAQVPGESEPFDRFGSAVAAGDFDADGFQDLAVGHPGEDNGNGAVTVIYGSTVGLRAEQAQAIDKATPGVPSTPGSDALGAALAVGDFDGDGFDDLAVGCPNDDIGVDNSGAVIVLYGSSDGLMGDRSQHWHQESPGIAGGAEEGDQFGNALAAGDFDGDGRDDLAVGVPAEDIGDVGGAGAINVLYGTDSGLASARNQFFSQDTGGVPGGAEPGDTFGSALAAGDFDGDGRDDLAIGAPREDIGSVVDAGYVVVLYGQASTGLGTAGAQDWTQDDLAGSGVEEGDWFGEALAAGDLDGDSFDDLVVGSPREDWTVNGTPYESSGAVMTVYGSAGALTPTGATFWGFSGAQGRTGSALAVGNPGASEPFLAVGRPRLAISEQAAAGRIVVFIDGELSAVQRGFSQDTGGIEGAAEADDTYGAALATGDFDGDGLDDLAVGVPGEGIGANAAAGAVNVLYADGGGDIAAAGNLLLYQGGPLATPAEGDPQSGLNALAAPAPNPVAGRTTLRYTLAQAGGLRLAVYDVLGREVAVLADGIHAAGEHQARFDVSALPPGVYLARLDAGDAVQVQRITVAR